MTAPITQAASAAQTMLSSTAAFARSIRCWFRGRDPPCPAAEKHLEPYWSLKTGRFPRYRNLSPGENLRPSRIRDYRKAI